jgi:hypothetical protein
MTAEITELSQWGVPGLIIVALAGYILLIEKRHSGERSDWQKSNERQVEEQNRNIRENTSVLSALKTLLENRIR